MAFRLFSSSSNFTYQNGLNGDSWEGSFNAAEYGGSEFAHAGSGEGVSEKSGGVGIIDDSSIPSNIVTIPSVQVIYRTQSTPSTAFGFRASCYKVGINAVSQEFGVSGTQTDTTITFNTDGVGAAWTRAEIFAALYGGAAINIPVAGGFTLIWSRVEIRPNFTLIAPTASTGSATNVTSSTATLGGTINPSGGTSTFPTSYKFEYGLTTAYGNSTSLVPQTGSSNIPVTANIDSLIGGTTYHFRVVAINDDHTINGSDQTFTTESVDPVVMVL